MDGKQLIQAAVAVALFLFAILYTYVEYFVAPLNHQREALQVQLAQANNEIATNTTQLHKLNNEEQSEHQNAALDQLLDRLLATVPAVPQVDCPSLLSKTMRRHEIIGSKISVSAFLPFRGVQEGLMQVWSIESPQVNPMGFGAALADIENQLPMAQITEFSLQRAQNNGPIRSTISVQFATFR